MFSAEEIRRSRLNSETQLITADDLLRQVVLDSHLAESIRLKRQPLAARQEAVLQQLENNLVVRSIDNTNTIEVSYRASTPERAADVLRQVFHAYLSSHRAIVRTAVIHQILQDALPSPAFSASAVPTSGVYERASHDAPLRHQARAQRYRERAEQASLTAQWLDRYSLSDLAILEEPSTPEIRGSVPLGVLLVLALLSSLLIGAVTALCLERLSGRVQDSSDIAQLTGVPVLASIPRNSIAPSLADASPSLYLAMQRHHLAFLGKLS